jgi:hypothetical protein
MDESALRAFSVMSPETVRRIAERCKGRAHVRR